MGLAKFHDELDKAVTGNTGATSSVSESLQSLSNGLSLAYSKLEERGAVMPVRKNAENLASTTEQLKIEEDE